MVRVSVVIPMYNAAMFIEETIYSVLNQSLNDLEVIVIDDGSTDHSMKIISSILDERITIIGQENQGVSKSRNSGLFNAKGKYVLFLDADDILDLKFLEHSCIKLENHPEIKFVGSTIRFFQNNIQNIVKEETSVNESGMNHILMHTSGLATIPSSYVFEREWLIKHNILFSVAISSPADKLFLLDCFAVSKNSLIANKAILYYRISSQSMSHKLTLKLAKDNLLFYKIVIQKKYHQNISDRKKAFKKWNRIVAFEHLRTKQFAVGIMHLFYYLLRIQKI